MLERIRDDVKRLSFERRAQVWHRNNSQRDRQRAGYVHRIAEIDAEMDLLMTIPPAPEDRA